MKNITPSTIEAFLSKNWFQLALLGIILIAVVKNADNKHMLPSMSEMALNQQGSAKSPAIQTMGLSFVSELFNNSSISRFEKPKTVEAIVKKPSVDRAKYDSRISAFIDRFSEVAVQEHAKYGIPASITLANGILLSDLGKSTLASEAQNYFMVPCTRSWDGDSMEINDGCFRWYDSPWESFRDHSLFVKQETGNTVAASNLSLVQWSKVIESIGWTNLKAHDILRAIKKYNLTEFDL